MSLLYTPKDKLRLHRFADRRFLHVPHYLRVSITACGSKTMGLQCYLTAPLLHVFTCPILRKPDVEQLVRLCHNCMTIKRSPWLSIYHHDCRDTAITTNRPPWPSMSESTMKSAGRQLHTGIEITAANIDGDTAKKHKQNTLRTTRVSGRSIYEPGCLSESAKGDGTKLTGGICRKHLPSEGTTACLPACRLSPFSEHLRSCASFLTGGLDSPPGCIS